MKPPRIVHSFVRMAVVVRMVVGMRMMVVVGMGIHNKISNSEKAANRVYLG